MIASPFLAALVAGPPPAVYAQACTGIQSGAAWLISQSLPPCGAAYSNVGAASRALQQLKTDASAWINQVFPNAAQWPATFALQATSVTGQLTTLGALVKQLVGPAPNPALAQQAQALIAQMLTTVTDLQTKSTALATALAGFGTAMSTDQGLSQSLVQTMWQDGSTQQAAMAALSGQLQQEASRTCPSTATEQALSSQIGQAQAQLAAIGDLLPLFQQAAAQTAQCAHGLGYLAGYWAALAADVARCAQGLQQAAGQPAALQAVDLVAVGQQWQLTLAFLQQASAASLA